MLKQTTVWLEGNFTHLFGEVSEMGEKELKTFLCESSDFTSSDYYAGLREMKQELLEEDDSEIKKQDIQLLKGVIVGRAHPGKSHKPIFGHAFMNNSHLHSDDS